MVAGQADVPFELLSPFDRQREILEIVRMLEPHKAGDFRKVRFGSAGDGGYVQLDDFKNIVHALSFGIADDDSWDLAMAKRGVGVEQFDHSIEKAPSNHSLLKFHRKIVAAQAGEGSVTLSELVGQFSKGKAPDLLLKIDIEGSEWEVFDTAPAEVLGRFTQIVCELHGLQNLSIPEFFPKAKRVLTKLNALYAVVHVHGNNFSPIVNIHNIALPEVIEVTFANRKRYSFSKSRERYPTPLDHPNDARVPDIQLGTFQF